MSTDDVSGIAVWANVADFAGPTIPKGGILSWRTGASYQRHGSAMDVPHVAHSLSDQAQAARREAVVSAVIKMLSPHSSHPITTCRISEQITDAVLRVLGLASPTTPEAS